MSKFAVMKFGGAAVMAVPGIVALENDLKQCKRDDEIVFHPTNSVQSKLESKVEIASSIKLEKINFNFNAKNNKTNIKATAQQQNLITDEPFMEDTELSDSISKDAYCLVQYLESNPPDEVEIDTAIESMKDADTFHNLIHSQNFNPEHIDDIYAAVKRVVLDPVLINQNVRRLEEKRIKSLNLLNKDNNRATNPIPKHDESYNSNSPPLRDSAHVSTIEVIKLWEALRNKYPCAM